MPFTFLSHQAPVLPLKLLRPRWFCGTALALGSMAPDFAYFLQGRAESRFGHTWLGQVVWCLPLTLLLTWLVRRVIARPLARRLPAMGPLRLNDYAVIADEPFDLVRTSASALTGSLSHLLLDGITHDYGWAVRAFPIMRAPVATWAGQPVPLFSALQYVGSLVLAAVVLGYIFWIGRRRALVRWSGSRPPEPTTEGRGLLLASVLAAALVGAVWGYWEHHLTRSDYDLILCAWLRSTCCSFFALAAACAWLERSPARRLAFA